MIKLKLLLGFSFTIFLHVAIFYSGLVEFLDLKVYDYSYKASIFNKHQANSSVVIIDIDEKSLDYLGQWPWSRLVLANLVALVSEQKPTSIGLDIIFPERDKTSPNEIISFYEKYFSIKVRVEGLDPALLDHDKFFANTLENTKSILSVFMSNQIQNKNNCFLPQSNLKITASKQDYMTTEYMLCNIEELQRSSFGVGFINSQRDIDGIFRRMPLFINYKKELIPAFGLANLMSADSLNIKDNSFSILGNTFSTNSRGEALLHFYDTASHKTLSAIDVLTHAVDLSVLKGKFVLIGTSSVGLHDRYMIASSQVIPGVFVHATLIDNIINNDLKFQPEVFKNLNFIFSLLFSLFLVYLLYKNEYIKLLVSFLSLGAIANILGFYFLHKNIYLSMGYFLVPFSVHFFIINFLFIVLYYRDRKKFYKDLTRAHSSTIDSMALVAETRDTETGAHIIRTKEYILILGEYLYENNIYKSQLGKPFRDLVYRAAPLHDIGKVGIPDNILKKPGKLTEEEYTIMKTHPIIGKDIIENAMKDNEDNEFLKIAYNIAYYHHEKWDGSGYPCGLSGKEIPLEARMMALADVYDALISRRCYKLSFDYENSETIIIDGSGTHFDPTLIKAFISLKDKFREIAERIKE